MKFNAITIMAGALALLSACTAPQQQLTKAGEALDVVAVKVDASRAKKTFGSAFSLDVDRAEEIAEKVIAARLEAVDTEGALPVTVDLDLEMLYLAGGVYALLGSTTSGSRGTLTVTRQGTDTPLLAETALSATGERRFGGLAGVVFVKGQETEMAQVSSSFAEKISLALFGR
ncbi:MAG: hypothetical protein KGZ72_13085 [Roseovarius sp.]|jgi:hypothetical protein|nr:hypothetical protein [Roseovarius sp.]